MSAAEPDQDDDASAGALSYVYKPSLFGAPCQFLLRQDGLQWQIGSYRGFIRFDEVRRVRMSYRPATMQSQRFVTEIWSAGNPKVQIASASWRNFMEQERLDPGYTAFVAELHRRLVAAGSTAQFTTGMPMVSYWIGMLVFGAALLALLVLTVRAMLTGEWMAAGLIGLFFVVFVLQIGNYFRRNRPGPYRPDAIPAGVLPRLKR
jgi:hypothetical protein